MILSLWINQPELGLVTEHKVRRSARAREKIHPVSWLWSYDLLKLLQSNCSPAESTVRRFDGAQNPRVDLLGEDCINLPWCARSQMKTGLHHCHIARKSNASISSPTQPKYHWQIYAMCTPPV